MPPGLVCRSLGNRQDLLSAQGFKSGVTLARYGETSTISLTEFVVAFTQVSDSD